ncbi:hypothetical protein BDN70DRAFT_174901 [Pholiota conissans]|uniref:Uncharacterized protein n=1 Tax=Pholiota conissans TaxID=109636 RepID=A0A9P5YWG4_9AGAR|nr:hypothetical protein BDN70DRAFT_174901 [Pholiota conissans]
MSILGDHNWESEWFLKQRRLYYILPRGSNYCLCPEGVMLARLSADFRRMFVARVRCVQGRVIDIFDSEELRMWNTIEPGSMKGFMFVLYRIASRSDAFPREATGALLFFHLRQTFHHYSLSGIEDLPYPLETITSVQKAYVAQCLISLYSAKPPFTITWAARTQRQSQKGELKRVSKDPQ